MRFYGVVRAAWGAGCAHMLFQTVSYTVVCVVLRDRHVENDPFHPLDVTCVPGEVVDPRTRAAAFLTTQSRRLSKSNHC